MPERRLSYEVRATDSASNVTSKIASNAKRDFGTVEESIEDAGTAGKRMADALERAAQEASTDLDRLEQTVDELARALGPEFVAKAGQGGVAKVVDDFRKAGLTFDEIEADADELAAAIRRVEEVGERAGTSTRAAFDGVDASARQVGDTVDKNRSVVANFAGNAIQDVPGVSGAFGALNVAAGQFAEYAAEGDINLRNMVGQIGGMVVLGTAIAAVSGSIQRSAEHQRRLNEQVDDWVEGMEDGKTAVDAMVDSFREAGKVEIPLADSADDITSKLDALGMTVEDFAAVTQMSQEELNEWHAAMQASGADAEALRVVVNGQAVARQQLARSTETAAIMERVGVAATRDATAATEDATRAAEENERAIEEQNEAMRSLAGVGRDLESAQIRVREAQRRLSEVMADGTATADDRRSAEIDLEEAIEDAGIAAQVAAETTARSQGLASIATQQGAAAQMWELGRLAGTLAEGSPLRAHLDAYIADLNDLERPRITPIGYSTSASGNNAGQRTGARAKGGPVRAGERYDFLEDGSEVYVDSAGRATLVPGSDGKVIPNDAIGALPAGLPVGGGEVRVKVDLTGGDTEFMRWLRKRIRVEGGL